jgi:hypothetical protein
MSNEVSFRRLFIRCVILREKRFEIARVDEDYRNRLTIQTGLSGRFTRNSLLCGRRRNRRGGGC